jgi:hypothetical protein
MQDYTHDERISLFDLNYRGTGVLGSDPARSPQFDYFKPNHCHQALIRHLTGWYLDDCRSFHRFRLLNVIELSLRTALHAVGMRYPENRLLGVYQRRINS